VVERAPNDEPVAVDHGHYTRLYRIQADQYADRP